MEVHNKDATQTHNKDAFINIRERGQALNYQGVIKAHFYKNNAKSPIDPQNLQEPVQYFRQTRTKIWE